MAEMLRGSPKGLYHDLAVANESSESPGEVTRLLGAWRNGDPQALNGLMPLVYAELHRIARRAWSSEKPGNTLQPTALIHEAYLQLIQSENSGVQTRGHFFAVASIAMRHILVNHAKASLSAKRGGGHVNVSLEEAEPLVMREAAEVVALHEALQALQALDPRRSRVVELRYFGGLSIEETAEVLGISTITVNRDWRLARTWLYREMKRK
jgi:RNA polymerase sigma-70 factor (ECF subfamily)